MKPENTPLEKENHLLNHHFSGAMLNFWGASRISSEPRHASRQFPGEVGGNDDSHRTSGATKGFFEGPMTEESLPSGKQCWPLIHRENGGGPLGWRAPSCLTTP